MILLLVPGVAHPMGLSPLEKAQPVIWSPLPLRDQLSLAALLHMYPMG